MEGKIVLCINDDWSSKGPGGEYITGPAFFDKDVVTAVTENEHGVFYQLNDRFHENSGFAADHFVVADEASETDIMPPDEVRHHIGQLQVRKADSDKRFAKTVGFLAFAGIVAVVGGFMVFKK